MVFEIPPTLTPPQRALWLSATSDGYRCGRKGGYQEQNPYTILEPLFDAWREGWFEGIYDLPIRELLELSKRVPSNIQHILAKEWVRIHHG